LCLLECVDQGNKIGKKGADTLAEEALKVPNASLAPSVMNLLADAPIIWWIDAF